MKTLGEVLSLSTRFLERGGVFRARWIAEQLIAHVVKLKRLDLYLNFDRPLEELELSCLRELLKRAVRHEPLEYLFESVSFSCCELFLNSHVLIPRQETELLVEHVCSSLVPLEGMKVWDLCTGSGCIGISLKKRFPQLDVSISDLSPKALAVAKKNVLINEVAVEVLEGDLLTPFLGKRADMVFCNPPYICEKEYPVLDPSVRDFEPKMALVGGEDGLEFYRRLSLDLPNYLKEGGKVFLEIGATQGSKVMDLFSSPCWKKKRLERDLKGHDRFFFLEFQ